MSEEEEEGSGGDGGGEEEQGEEGEKEDEDFESIKSIIDRKKKMKIEALEAEDPFLKADEGEDVMEVDELDWDLKMSPLHYSVFFGHISCIKALLDARADKAKSVVYMNDSGLTIKTYSLLELTVISDQPKAAQLLLQQGVSITHLDDSLETVLHKAARAGKTELVTLFLEWKDPKDPSNKLDINKFSIHFDTPLTLAIDSHYEWKKIF